MPNTSGAAARVCGLKAEKLGNTKCGESTTGIFVFKYADSAVVSADWHTDNINHVTLTAVDIKSSAHL